MSGWGAVLPDKDMVLGGTAPSERMREDSLITGGRWSCLMSDGQMPSPKGRIHS